MRSFKVVVEDGGNRFAYWVKATDVSGALAAASVEEARENYKGSQAALFNHRPRVSLPNHAAAYSPAHGGRPGEVVLERMFLSGGYQGCLPGPDGVINC